MGDAESGSMSERVWRGNPKLEPLLVLAESIQTHPRNPRRGDLPLLAESLDGFGQTRPIVVHPETGYIVAGNHTYRAATEILAWTHIAVSRPQLEPAEYEQFLLMDNRASDLSEYDEDVLIPILQGLQDKGDFAYTGWDDDRAEEFIDGADRVSRDAEREFRAGLDDDSTDEENDPNTGRLFKKPPGTANQLMLAYTRDSHAEVVRNLGVLRREYGTEGIGPTAARAIANQFDIVFRGADT